MTRLKKELIKRGILFDEEDKVPYDPYEAQEELFCISNGLIITIYTCNVLDPSFRIYDTNYNFIGSQDCFKQPRCGYIGFNPFCSYGNVKEDDDNDFEELMKEDRQSHHYEQYEIDWE